MAGPSGLPAGLSGKATGNLLWQVPRACLAALRLRTTPGGIAVGPDPVPGDPAVAAPSSTAASAPPDAAAGGAGGEPARAAGAVHVPGAAERNPAAAQRGLVTDQVTTLKTDQVTTLKTDQVTTLKTDQVTTLPHRIPDAAQPSTAPARAALAVKVRPLPACVQAPAKDPICRLYPPPFPPIPPPFSSRELLHSAPTRLSSRVLVLSVATLRRLIRVIAIANRTLRLPALAASPPPPPPGRSF